MNDSFRTSFDSLEELAEVVSEALQCPITIEDANHRLLAYSTHDERTDPARVSTIIGRRVPEKVINHLWKEGVIPALLTSREPIRIKTMDDIGLGDRVAVSIWKNQEVLGFIWALEINKSLVDEDLELLKRAAAATKNKLMQVQNRKNKKDERYQEFFWKLLTSHLSSNEEIVAQFHALQITPPSKYAVVVFQFSQGITGDEEKQIAYLIKTNQLPNIVLHTIDHHQLILFISLHRIEKPLQILNQFCEMFVNKMMERFRVEPIILGFSGVHSDYRKIERSYRDALTVLTIKGKFPEEVTDINCYQNLGIYHYIDGLLGKLGADGYGNDSLKKLRDYDQKNQCNLVQTLEVFLMKDSNVNEAAKKLNVHSNTLNYRLKRIAEIGDINLKNVNEKITLYLDLKLEKFL